jgi:hypothetical protein
VELADVGQRLREDFGLVARRDVEEIGHEREDPDRWRVAKLCRNARLSAATTRAP